MDSPKLSDEGLARMRPMREAMPELLAALTSGKKRGPTRRKTLVSIRLDDNVLAGLRASGPGWQSRFNDVARKLIEEPCRDFERHWSTIPKGGLPAFGKDHSTTKS